MTTAQAGTRTTDETEIRRLIADHEAAMRSKDAPRALAAYAPEVVEFDLAPPLRHTGSREQFIRELQDWFAGKGDGEFEYEIRDLTVTAGGDAAFCHSLNRMGAPAANGDEGFELWFRSTLGLRRIDGAWRITHVHTSTPFYMDGSNRAALDLQP